MAAQLRSLWGLDLCEHTRLTRTEGLANQMQAPLGTAPIALPSTLSTWGWAPKWPWERNPYYHRMEMVSFCFLEPHKSI